MQINNTRLDLNPTGSSSVEMSEMREFTENCSGVSEVDPVSLLQRFPGSCLMNSTCVDSTSPVAVPTKSLQASWWPGPQTVCAKTNLLSGSGCYRLSLGVAGSLGGAQAALQPRPPMKEGPHHQGSEMNTEKDPAAQAINRPLRLNCFCFLT